MFIVSPHRFFMKALLAIAISSQLCHAAEKKYVIGCWKSGFFSGFLSVLNHLHWCDENNLTPVVYWDGSCHFSQPGSNKNGWEFYFEPVSPLKYTPGDAVHDHYWIDGHATFMMGINDDASRALAHKLITKYVKIKRSLLRRINTFYSTFMKGKKTIGIHLRGTDKPQETPVVPLTQMIEEALKHADATTQFFIASEDINLFNQAKAMLAGRVVLAQDCMRVSSNSWMWFLGVSDRVRLGREVLMDAVLLSRCDVLVHTASNVSTAALFFNPQLKSVMLINGAINFL